MDFEELKDDYKFDFISMSKGFFDNSDVFTKYSIMKIKGATYIVYRGTHSTGNGVIFCNRVEEVSSVVTSEGENVNLNNSIVVGGDLKGTYDNGLTFHFTDIIQVSARAVSDLDRKLAIERGQNER